MRPDVVSPDHGGALFSARVLKIRDRCRKARDLHRRAWDVYRAACGGVSTLDERVSAVVCNANLDRLGARDADEAVEQDGVLRGGLFPSGMPSHKRRGGSSHEPAGARDPRTQTGAWTAIKARPSYGYGAGPCC